MSIDTVYAKIKQTLIDNGFGESIGRIYGPTLHTCGIPDPHIKIRPEYSPIDGDHVIIVTATFVASATCLYPSNYNNWHLNRYEYSTPEEMIALVTKLAKPDTGCWT